MHWTPRPAGHAIREDDMTRCGVRFVQATVAVTILLTSPVLAVRVPADADASRHVGSATQAEAKSAARTLEALIAARGCEAAAAEYRKTVAGKTGYSLVEREFATLGSGYMDQERVLEAATVFEIMTEAFPRSWSAWNSLGKACVFAGNNARAEAAYVRSVALNPKNEDGREMLGMLRGWRLDEAAETKATLRFKPGTKTGLAGPYLGQTPPGLTPAVFAPGLVSVEGQFDFAITFTPDGREVYFTQRKEGEPNRLMMSRLETDGWTAPEAAAFAKGFPDAEPHVTPDGRALYFGSRRPQPGSAKSDDGIWVVTRTAGGTWGAPRYHGPGMYVSSARSGNLYMTDVTNAAGTGEGAAIVYPWTAGRFGRPQRLGGGVNTPRVADHAFVAPDESYILLDSTRPGGEGDLYVCFRRPDGSWSEAVNLGDAVNTPGTTFCPSVSPDGRYIFYTANNDIYWVSAKILEPLRARVLGAGSAR
jgi:hypothetical protein